MDPGHYWFSIFAALRRFSSSLGSSDVIGRMTPRPTLTIRDGLARTARLHPDLVAVVDGDRPEKAITYRELDERATRLANALSVHSVEAGDFNVVRKGDVVAVFSPNTIQHLEIMFAASQMGATFASLAHLLSNDQIGVMLNEFEVKLLFLHSSYIDQFALIAPLLTTVELVVLIGESTAANRAIEQRVITFDKLVSNAHDGPLSSTLTVDGSDLCVILFTSGTVSMPKAVQLTSDNVYDIAHQGQPGQSFIMTSSFSWVSTTVVATSAVLHAVRLIVYQRYDPNTFFDDCCVHKPSLILLAGQMFRDITMLDQEQIDRLKSFVKVIIYSGTSFPINVIKRAVELFAPQVYLMQIYSSTESLTRGTTLSPVDHIVGCSAGATPVQQRRLSSAGQASSPNTQVAIHDDKGVPCGPNVSGNIVLRSKLATKGYYLNATATEALFQDGWLQMGDIGHMDEDGYLYVSHRANDVIVNRYCGVVPVSEVQDAVNTCSDVADVLIASVSLPRDPLVSIAAFVIPTNPRLQADEVEALKVRLLDHCRSVLAPVKVPDLFYVLKRFPEIPDNNKVLKRELVDCIERDGDVERVYGFK